MDDELVSHLLHVISACKRIYEKIVKEYGQDFANDLPLDKNLLKFLKNDCRTVKFQPLVNNAGKKWSEQQYDIVRQMIFENNTVEQIAKYMGRTEYSIECVLVKLGLVKLKMAEKGCFYYEKSLGQKENNQMTIKEASYMYNLFLSDKSIEYIAEKLKKSPEQIE